MGKAVARLREQLEQIEAGFVGRAPLVDKLVKRLMDSRRGQTLISIIAPPFLGKTILMRNLASICREHRYRIAAFMPGSGIANEQNFYARLSEELLTQWKGGWITPPSEWSRWERLGEEIMRHLNQESALLLVDDFDELASHRGKLVAHFRAQLQTTSQLMTVISLSPESAELLTDQRSPLYGASSEIIRLEPLDRSTCEQYWRKIEPSGSRLSSSELGQLYDETAGEPLLLKACARTLAISATGDLEDFLAATASTLFPFYSVWLSQLPGQQRLILDTLASHPEQVAPSLARESGLQRTLVSTQLQRMLAAGHVTRREGQYRLRPLWQFWFKWGPRTGHWQVRQWR